MSCVKPSQPVTVHCCCCPPVLRKSVLKPQLTADLARPLALPLSVIDHSDLKSISRDTLAALLRGDYQDRIHHYQLIDCRYPFQYRRGHIDGATNLFIEEQMKTLLDLPPQASHDNSRNIVIFYEEYSEGRAAVMCRYLRTADSLKHVMKFPYLQYPEVYLLHGGYREFLRRHPHLCSH